MSKFVRVNLIIALTLVIILGSLSNSSVFARKHHQNESMNVEVNDKTPSQNTDTNTKTVKTHDGSAMATTTTDQVTQSPPPQIPIIGDSETKTDESTTPTTTTNNIDPPVQTFPIPPDPNDNTSDQCKHHGLCNHDGGSNDVKVIKKIININIGVSRHTSNNHDSNNVHSNTNIVNTNQIVPQAPATPKPVVTRNTNITNQLTVGEMISACKDVNPNSPIGLQDNCTVLMVSASNYCITHKSVTNSICLDPLYLSNVPQYIQSNNINLKPFPPTIFNIVI